MLTAQQQLETFLDKKAVIFAQAIENLARSMFSQEGGHKRALRDLAELISKTMILADLNGRKRILMEADHASATARFAENIPDKTPISGALTFDEAIEDLLTREPRLAASAAEVSRLYSTSKTFAMAKSADMVLTKRVQSAIGSLMEAGASFAKAEEVMKEITPFSQAYSATVYRTNCSTAYTQGRFQQVQDPEVTEIIPALEYVSLCDGFTRPNHCAGNGAVIPVNDPLWKVHHPPQGKIADALRTSFPALSLNAAASGRTASPCASCRHLG